MAWADGFVVDNTIQCTWWRCILLILFLFLFFFSGPVACRQAHTQASKSTQASKQAS